ETCDCFKSAIRNPQSAIERSAIQRPQSLCLQCSRPYQFTQARAELGERHRADISLDTIANRNCACLGFSLADDQHERYLFELGVTNLGSDLFTAQVDGDAMPGLLHLALD